MAEQFENPKEEEVEEETAMEVPPEKEIKDIANKAAEKSGKREKKFDEDHTIFSN
ncbi:MAG: hypothetical protein ABSF16_02950 [Terracidiphilus sp.]|jgi:hypothetical protein